MSVNGQDRTGNDSSSVGSWSFMSAKDNNGHHRTSSQHSTGSEGRESNLCSSPAVLRLDQFTKEFVVIQKDERGYGLRVIGESPVFVEDVRPGGAADKAGVRPGDKIMMVSGTLVTRHHHGEVVRMIQNCGSYVGMTLLRLKTPPPAARSIQITCPQPASVSTQQAYDDEKVNMFKDGIRQEKNRLEKLMTKKNKSASDQSRIDKAVGTIKYMEKGVEKMTFDATRHRHTSMSAENLTTGAGSDPMMAASTSANTKKSHSFGQCDTRAPIMTMESDDENEDFANNYNVNNSRRNSSLITSNSKTYCPVISDIPKTVDALHGHCLQMTRWLLEQNLPPHALLFYTMAGHVFPNLAAQTPRSGRKSVQRLAWQIASTWLVKEAPLTFAEFPSDLLDKFAVSLETSQSSLETLFEPYFETTRALIKEQLEKWRKAVIIGCAPPVMPTAKEELQAAIEIVLNDPSRDDIEQTVDSLIAHLNSHNASTLAMVIVLLTVGHFVFACPSKHLLFSPINPVLKLSIDSTKKPKRAKSLPARNHNSVGHFEAGHHFMAISDITKPIYCAACYGSIWGTYGLTCANCQMTVHAWCMKSAAVSNQCEPTDANSSDTTPHMRPTKNNRRRNSDRYSILDRIKKTVAPYHDSRAPLLSSSSESDDDGRDQVLTPDIAGSPTTTSANNWQLSSSDDEDEDQSQNDAQQNPGGFGSGQSATGTARQESTAVEVTPPPLPPRPPSEKRRQIHKEIIDTEKSHLDALKFIQNIFYKPLKQEQLLTQEQLSLVFRNTKNLLRVHRQIFKKLKASQHCIEQALHDIFCGQLGRDLEHEASFFCSRHKVGALDTWKARKKDSRLKNLLDPELRSKSIPDCPLARLSLEDLLGMVFQRPLRYQLLLDRLLHATPSDSEEHRQLALALSRCREIGSMVNEETRRVESEQRLQEITRKTDKTQGLLLNLTDHALVHEGPLTWRMSKQKFADVHLVLTDKILVILARDSNDRFILKYHTNPAIKTNLANNKTQYSPIVLLHDLFTRDLATDPTAFFLISTDQDVFYEFAAATPLEKKHWTVNISNTTDAYNVSRLQSVSNTVSELRDLTASPVNVIGDSATYFGEDVDRDGDDETTPSTATVPSDQTNGTLTGDDQQNNNNGDTEVNDNEKEVAASAAQSREQRIAEIDFRVKQLLDEKRHILANERHQKPIRGECCQRYGPTRPPVQCCPRGHL